MVLEPSKPGCCARVSVAQILALLAGLTLAVLALALMADLPDRRAAAPNLPGPTEPVPPVPPKLPLPTLANAGEKGHAPLRKRMRRICSAESGLTGVRHISSNAFIVRRSMTPASRRPVAVA